MEDSDRTIIELQVVWDGTGSPDECEFFLEFSGVYVATHPTLL